MNNPVVVEINIHEDQVKAFYTNQELLKKQIKEQSQTIKDSFKNDDIYCEITEEIQELQKKRNEIKARIIESLALSSVQDKISDLRSDLKDVQGGLFDHLDAYVRTSNNSTIKINGVSKVIVKRYSIGGSI